MIKEDAPTNSAGGTPDGKVGVAGIGVGPQGEPGVSPKVQKKRYGKTRTPLLFPDMIRRSQPKNIVESRRKQSFAGAAVFEVSSSLFHNLTMQKRKGKHWRTYLEEDDCYAEIREYASNNNGPIAIQNEKTGEMRYIRYKG